VNCPDGPVTLIDQFGLRLAEIIEIGEAVAGRSRVDMRSME
jgi:hypothetical protein